MPEAILQDSFINMSRSKSANCCYNPIWKYLEESVINDAFVQELASRERDKRKRVRDSDPASIMYTDGTIRPLKGGFVDEIVPAIGFHGGRVVAAGTVADVKAKMDGVSSKYDVVHLSKGQTLLPGLIEPHVHILASAIIAASWNDFGPFEGQYLRIPYDQDVLKQGIEEAKASLPSDFWILGNGVDPSIMPFEKKEDDLNVLQRLDVDTVDSLENDIPVFMMSASGHTAYVNTTSLKIIYDETKPPYESFEAYRQHVNAGGGLQELEEIIPALGAIPPKQLRKSVLASFKGLSDLFELANQRGVTMLYDAGMSKQMLLLMKTYLLFNPARVRLGYGELCDSLEYAQNLDQYKPITEIHDLFRGNIKIVSDGANQGLTGYQHDTYRCEPADNTGLFNFPDINKFQEMVKEIVQTKGWPAMIHGNGDKAIEYILDAYQGVVSGNSGLDKRLRIEHCSIPTEKGLQRMAEMGISPSFLIGHVCYWGYVFKEGIFEEKSLQLGPCQSALSKGLRISLHTDYFVSPLGPLRMMEQAITRIMEQDPDHRVLNEDEKLTPAQALRAVTYDAAWQCHADKWVGSLEEGKMADYVILGEDPITRKDAVGMRDIPVLETWVGGIKRGFLKYV